MAVTLPRRDTAWKEKVFPTAHLDGRETSRYRREPQSALSMSNVFPKRFNSLSWKAPLACVLAVVFAGAGIAYYCTPKFTQVGYEPLQPIPFSHALHVRQLGLDCRFCHSFSDVAGHSNMPTAQTCMSCHTQIKPDSPLLASVRAVWNGGKGGGPPLNWIRVNRLPDYVYFNHAAHVTRGVSCYSCHGGINEMEIVAQEKPLSMAWCLDCHRAPEKFLRPADKIFNMDWRPASPGEQDELGLKLKHEWAVDPPVNCGGCHR